MAASSSPFFWFIRTQNWRRKCTGTTGLNCFFVGFRHRFHRFHLYTLFIYPCCCLRLVFVSSRLAPPLGRWQINGRRNRR